MIAMNRPEYTPDKIQWLDMEEYIVVGTNYEGKHAGGAAAYAHNNFGLQWGCGEGLSGQAYALPTMDGLKSIEVAAVNFMEFAKFNPDKIFYLTRVGCGIAGYTDKQIAPLFKNALENVIKPKGW